MANDNRQQTAIVTGAKGQLGVDMVDRLNRLGYRVYGYSREELDIADSDRVMARIKADKPDVVIHCAAYTKVDQAESEPEEAYRINAYGTRNVAVAAEACGSKLVYVSTDYVFDGSGSQPYHEFASTGPMSVYGHSKLEGERFVRQLHSRWFIVRTSWVFGKHGGNFVKTMLQLAQSRDKLTVVADQVGCPTYTADLAERISDLIESERYGVYHISNSGHCSWHEFAQAIMKEAGLAVEVIPITTNEFPRPAKRPAFSVLDSMALRLNQFSQLRSWREALAEFMKDIN
ncbi:NAD(P)-dependent oxidoreductase [Cohnella xylanilytica]|uniref:dTDP-4-dehydrorhamnose reductase n=1 Tax=Cohnella xylanilytica TaxID=557555 RepID=UPI001B06AAB0|nr:dTDP-4-dehydrorhamnose reductase [Cohnella xylanilytica]GIO12268.1 NAD(P)-dependent oxidoreductase [Cohnella xylanilytica]